MDKFLENTELYTLGFISFLIIYRNVLEIKKNTNRKILPISVIFTLTILVLVIPILIILFTLFLLYRQVVNIVLKTKYGHKYRGLVEGADAFHNVDDSTNNVINALCIMKVKKEVSPEDFFKNIQRSFWNLRKYPKFTSIFFKSFGYSYMIEGDLTVDDCIRKMKTIECKNDKMSEEELLKLLDECCNSPLNINETVSWEMLVGIQPLHRKQDEYNYYPAIFRVNHAVADGVTLTKLFAGALCDRINNKIEDVVINHANFTFDKSRRLSLKAFVNLYDKIKIIFEDLIKSLYAIILAPSAIIVNFMLKGKDKNILQRPKISGEKFLVYSTEDSQEYFNKTKRIKNRIPGTAFPDVILTAFAASLNDYFKMNSTHFPEQITATIPLVPGSSSLQKLIPGEYNKKPLKVINGYSVVLMNLPLYIRKDKDNEENTSLLSRLELIKKEVDILKNSVDYQVAYFILSIVCAVLPHSLVKFMLSGMHWTTVLSIIPGPPTATYCDQSVVVNDVIAWVPHLHNLGVTFCANSYAGRLQLGLSVDKALISDQKTAQSIVDGVFKYLDALEKELDCGL